MELLINTRVDEDFRVVFSGFDQELFERLSPPFPRLKLLRFDGCKPGDLVEVEVDSGFFKQKWSSLVTELTKNDYEIFFIDEGLQLPTPLKYWRHKHLLSKNGGYTLISDKIEYKTSYVILDYLLYPFFYAQFAYRKPVYRKIFNRKKRLGTEIV